MLELVTWLQKEMRTNSLVVNKRSLETQKAFPVIQGEKFRASYLYLSSGLVNWHKVNEGLCLGLGVVFSLFGWVFCVCVIA